MPPAGLKVLGLPAHLMPASQLRCGQSVNANFNSMDLSSLYVHLRGLTSSDFMVFSIPGERFCFFSQKHNILLPRIPRSLGNYLPAIIV